MRRAGLELSAFLEIHAPGGGHDPRALTAQHMQQFAADQLQRERDGLVSLGFRGRAGKPSIVTANTRLAVFHRTRILFRQALESGEAERIVAGAMSDEFGLTAQERAQMIPSGRAKLMDNRVDGP